MTSPKHVMDTADRRMRYTGGVATLIVVACLAARYSPLGWPPLALAAVAVTAVIARYGLQLLVVLHTLDTAVTDHILEDVPKPPGVLAVSWTRWLFWTAKAADIVGVALLFSPRTLVVGALLWIGAMLSETAATVVFTFALRRAERRG